MALFEIHHYHHFDHVPCDIAALIADIKAQLNRMESKETQEMAKLDDAISALQAQVATDTTVIGSATTLIQGFAAQLAAAVAAAQAAGATPAQLASLTDLGNTIAANDATLAAAVAANTPPPAA